MQPIDKLQKQLGILSFRRHHKPQKGGGLTEIAVGFGGAPLFQQRSHHNAVLVSRQLKLFGDLYL